MQACASLSAPRLSLPAARCARARPQAAQAAAARGQQRAAARSPGASRAAAATSGGAPVQQLVARSFRSDSSSSIDDLINANYDLGLEERIWLQAWHSLSIAPPANPVAVAVQLGKLLQQFAALTPEQKWQVAWTQLDPDWRRYLVHTRYAASSEGELVQKAAAEHAAHQQTDLMAAPPLPVQLVLAAACSRCTGWAAGTVDAGAEGQAAMFAGATASMGSSFSGSGGTAGEVSTAKQQARMEAVLCAAGAALLQWFGWKQAAAAGWTLPAAPWGGGTVAAVLGAWSVAQALCAAFWIRLDEQTVPESIQDDLVEQWGRSFAFRAAHGVSALAITAGILQPLVLGPYPHTVSQGLFKAWLWPLQSWLPTVAAMSALQACLVLITLKGSAAFRVWSPRKEPDFVDGVNDLTAAALSSKRRWSALLLSTAVFAPIWEELAFRGFLLPSLALWLPPGAAVALSSLLFAAIHPAGLARIPKLWWAGSLFGWCYAITGNLLAPIVLHSIFNLIVCVHVCWLQSQQAVQTSG